MKIIIEHRERDFNVSLASKDGAQPFITIKGCRVVKGTNGDFVSWPAKKLDSGKWWNHVYASDAFQVAVLAEVAATAPKKKAPVDDDGLPNF